MGFYPLSPTCQIKSLSDIYESVFGQRSDGTFVEVGAFDGDNFSNTCGLADIGWHGIYIEPVYDYAIACRQRHAGNPRIMVVDSAVGDRPGEATIYVAQAFSTLHADELEMSKQQMRLWSGADDRALEAVFTGKTETVPVERLETILANYRVKPSFELLVVDVDGHEPEVFDSFDLGVWRPRMMIVELTDDNPHYAPTRARAAALRARITAGGYTPIHVDPCNTIFVDASAAPTSPSWQPSP